MDFKNFFVWLMGLKKLIFQYFEFFGSGHFLVIFIDVMGQNNGQSKKSYLSKKSVFHAHQLRAEIFKIRSYRSLLVHMIGFEPR